MENHKVIGISLDWLYHYLQIIVLCHEDEYLQAKRKSENRKDKKISLKHCGSTLISQDFFYRAV